MVDADWAPTEDVLFASSEAAIRRFAQEHPDELFSAFAFSIDWDYAAVALILDTLGNSLREARLSEERHVEYRNDLYGREDGWRYARYSVEHFTNRTLDWNARGPFKYEEVPVALITTPAWVAWFNRFVEEELPETGGTEFEGRVILSLWRVTERLVKSRAFGKLRLSSPFRIAFAFHDDDLIVLRILNWPDHEYGPIVAAPANRATGHLAEG